VRWRLISAICLGVWLAMWLLGGDREPDAQVFQVGRVRTGHIIASGLVSTDPDHPNFRIVGGLLIVVHPDGIPVVLIDLYHGKRVELVIREVQ
jgi:hypothetical protein